MRMLAADCAQMRERHVQAIWYDAALRPSSLRTMRGCRVEVVDPGAWNLEAGPDFLKAVLRLGRNRRRVEGDVEIHLRPSDWTAHGHGDDLRYSGVVAHVTWYAGVPPDSLPDGCVSVCLGRCVAAFGGISPCEIDVAAYPYAKLPATPRPCEGVLADDPDLAVEVLRMAGRARIAMKAQRLAALMMRRGDPDQVFYEELFCALGYSKNTVPFRALAERLPLRNLPLSEVAAYEALNCVAEVDVAACHSWRRANVRPNGTPEVRMADAAAMFTGGKPRHIGRGMSAAILTNVIVPIAIARGRLSEPPRWLPPECMNAVMRLAAFRLFGRDHNPALYSGNGVLQQGLIHIHREHCLAVRQGCDSCRLLAAIRKAANERG